MDRNESSGGVWLRAAAADLTRVRFAITPMGETLQCCRVLRDPGAFPLHAHWVRRSWGRLADLDLDPLLKVLPRPGYVPDFLSPPPVDGDPCIDAELAVARAAPLDQVEHELREVAASTTDPAVRAHATALSQRPGDARDLLCDLIEQLWHRVLSHDWQALRTILHADVLYRARELAACGLSGLLAGLHDSVRWTGHAIHLDRPYEADRRLGGSGLLLVPSAFVWPTLSIVMDGPWQPTLIYPARGFGQLWAEPSARPADPLSALLGAGRARVLAVLGEPAGTVAVARRAGLAPATVSEHLTVLRTTGLIRSLRDGSRRLHERTTLGDALFTASAVGVGVCVGVGDQSATAGGTHRDQVTHGRSN